MIMHLTYNDARTVHTGPFSMMTAGHEAHMGLLVNPAAPAYSDGGSLAKDSNARAEAVPNPSHSINAIPPSSADTLQESVGMTPKSVTDMAADLAVRLAAP